MEWRSGWVSLGGEARRGMNKRASGIEGEGDRLRQQGCEWEKLLSLSVRPGLPPPTRVVSLRGRKCITPDNVPEFFGLTHTHTRTHTHILHKEKGKRLWALLLWNTVSFNGLLHIGADNEHMARSDHFTSARWVIWNAELPEWESFSMTSRAIGLISVLHV